MNWKKPKLTTQDTKPKKLSDNTANLSKDWVFARITDKTVYSSLLIILHIDLQPSVFQAGLSEHNLMTIQIISYSKCMKERSVW